MLSTFSLNSKIDFLLQEEKETGIFHDAERILDELEAAKREVIKIKNRYKVIVAKINGKLALAVRKILPGLNISLDGTRCGIGYKSKSLIFSPEIHSGIWKISSPDVKFEKDFIKKCGYNTALLSDVEMLAKDISEYFSAHYRSLHEDVVGVGNILLEGKRSTLYDLARAAK